ncbi:unnamed protein product [Bubo scandiacus]
METFLILLFFFSALLWGRTLTVSLGSRWMRGRPEAPGALLRFLTSSYLCPFLVSHTLILGGISMTVSVQESPSVQETFVPIYLVPAKLSCSLAACTSRLSLLPVCPYSLF